MENREPSISEAAGLLSLPDELLLLIFETVQPEELLSVSFLSKRLHYVAFPMYLTRCGIPFRALTRLGQLVLRGENLNSIPLLQMSLSVTSLRHLSFTFRSFELASMRTILRDIRRLDRFLSNLKSLDEVTLDLMDISWRLWYPDRGYQRELGFRLVSHMGFLLNTIIARSCKTLTVLRGAPVGGSQGSIQAQTPAHAPSSFLVSRSIAAMKKVAGAMMAHRQTRPPSTSFSLGPVTLLSIIDDHRSIRVSRDARSKSTLTTFRIHCPLLLVHPCLSWTIEILNISPITCLSLGPMSLSSESWALVLATIDVPAVSELSIDSCNIELAHLIPFLSRHPLIARLHLNRIFRPPMVSLPATFLPHLTTLSADPEGLITFFSVVGDKPALNSICIFSRILLDNRFQPARLNSTLRPLAPRLSENIVSLRICVQSGSTDWLDSDPHDAVAGDPLSYVTRLDFVSEFVYASHPPTWLGLFPSLERVSFFHCTEPSMDVAQFVHTISVSCPSIRKVEINVENGGWCQEDVFAYTINPPS